MKPGDEDAPAHELPHGEGAAAGALTVSDSAPRDTSRESDAKEAEMSEQDTEGPRESEPNPTQESIDREGASDQPADVGGWEDNEPSTHAGEGGQTDDVA